MSCGGQKMWCHLEMSEVRIAPYARCAFSCMKRTTRVFASQTTDPFDLLSIETERASWVHNAPGIEMSFQGF